MSELCLSARARPESLGPARWRRVNSLLLFGKGEKKEEMLFVQLAGMELGLGCVPVCFAVSRMTALNNLTGHTQLAAGDGPV